MNVKILKSKMVLAGDEDFVTNVAEVIHKSRQTAGSKLSGKVEFTLSEIALISKHYGFTGEELKNFVEGESNNEG